MSNLTNEWESQPPNTPAHREPPRRALSGSPKPSAGGNTVTVDEGIAPPASATKPCVPVTPHPAPPCEAPCHGHPGGLVSGVLTPSPDGFPAWSPIPDDASPVHSVSSVPPSSPLPTPVPTSAYPGAFLQALASWGILPPCRMRLTPAPEGARHRVPPFLLSVCRGVQDPPLRRVSRGCLRGACTLAQPSALPFGPSPYPASAGPRNDDSDGDSVACPVLALLDGIPGRVPSDRLLASLWGLRVSRSPRGYAINPPPGWQAFHLHGRASYQRSY